MATFLLVIHLMIAAALVGVVLLQRSEGGALGIGGGGGGGGGGFLTGRGTANLLTRITAGLAAAFFVTSLGLTILAGMNKPQGSLIGREAPTQQSPIVPTGTPPGGADKAGSDSPPAKSDTPAPRGGILDKLQGNQPSFPPKN